MLGPQRMPPVLLAVFAVAAAAVLWLLVGVDSAPRPGPDGETEPTAAGVDEPAPPLLVGAGRAPRAEATAERRDSSAAGGNPTPVASSLPVAKAAPPGAVLGPLFPLAPGAVEDRIARSAPAPIVLPRAHVVGRVLPYGLREMPRSLGSPDWRGVARVEREERAPSEAEDATREPLTTAVRGMVVAQDGSPIVGAEVILYSCFYLRQAYYDHRVRQIGREFTDSDGVFDMRPIDLDTVHFGADGEVLVTVRHARRPDLVAQPLPGIVPGQESDVGRLVLPQRTARVSGTIRDLQGRGIEGAAVRVSGAMNPVDYDKTERMVVLDACPTAITDHDGRYELQGFAGGLHELSVHVHIDCVLHVRGTWTGEREWSPRVLAGNGVRGRVVDADGEPVAAAVVAGGGNWTPTNADGTFWLDNVQPGPLTLEVAHHLWRTVFVPDVETNTDDVTLTLTERLPRVTLEVVDASEAPVALVAIDWTWSPGRGPGRFAPDSRYWHEVRGIFDLVVPEGAQGAVVSRPDASARHVLAPEDFADGARMRVTLSPP